MDGEDIQDIVVYNVAGQLITSITFREVETNSKIDLTPFSSGIYTILVTTSIGSRAFQIVKN